MVCFCRRPCLGVTNQCWLCTIGYDMLGGRLPYNMVADHNECMSEFLGSDLVVCRLVDCIYCAW